MSAGPACSEERRPLFRLRLLLQAPLSRVAGALQGALQAGQPGDGQGGGGAARRLAEAWIAQMSGSAPVPNLAESLQFFDENSISLGLRPLRAGDSIENHFAPQGALWTIDAGSSESSDNKCQIFAEEDAEGRGCSDLCYKIQVYSHRISDAVRIAREQGKLDDMPRNIPTGGIEMRCRIRSCGSGPDGPLTELVRELTDGRALCHAAPAQQRSSGARPGAPRPPPQPDPADEVLKGLCIFLEEESRAWAAAHGFAVLRVWRKVGCRISALIWSSWLMSMLHCCNATELGTQEALDHSETQWLGAELAELLSRSRCGKEEPDTIHTQRRHLTEGSVDIVSFGDLLLRTCRSAEPEDDIFRRFVDLGSGRGNAVLAAHAMLPFHACSGVEIQESCIELSLDRVGCYVHSGLANFAASQVDPRTMFIQGDFFKDIDWSDASVVFVAALCLTAGMVKDIAIAALRLQPGALLMILGGWHLSRNKTVPRDIELLDSFEFSSDSCLVSWQAQLQQCNIYRRL